MVRNPCGIRGSFYSLFPVACALGSREGDEELYHMCTAFLSMLAEALHDANTLHVAINSVDQVNRKKSCLCYLSMGKLNQCVFRLHECRRGVPERHALVFYNR